MRNFHTREEKLEGWAVTVPLHGSKIVYSSGRAAANDSYGRWFVSRWRLFYSSSPKIGAKKFAPKFRREKFPFSSENYGSEIFLYLQYVVFIVTFLFWCGNCSFLLGQCIL